MLPSLRLLPAAASAALLFTAACSRGAAPPDVLFISLDSVRADTLTFLDERTAPNMTRLARNGTVFTQALSGTSWTLPAHAQMFTGTPPLLHGVQIDTIRIDPLQPTLPELLRDAGYRTNGFWTGWYLADEYGFARGFDRYESAMTLDPAADTGLREALEERGDSPGSVANIMRAVSSHRDVTSQEVAVRARAAIEATPAGERLFLFAHLFDPHYDYIPPPPFDTRFDPDYAGDIDGRGYWDNLRIYDPAKKPPRQISDRDLEHVRALYRGEVAWADAAVGRMIDALEAAGRLENTLIVITSDHGEEFFEHGDRGHRQTLFDEVLRVPLLIVPPGSAGTARAHTSDAQVTLSDLLPTVLDYVGERAPPTVYGRSLRPLVEGGALPERPAVSSLLLRFENKKGGGFTHVLAQAVRTPGSKFVRTVQFRGGRPNVRSILQYDLTADPGEREPVQLSAPELELSWKAFEDDLEPVRAAFDAATHSPAEERGTRARDAFAGDLAALGYADGGGDPEEDAAPKPWLWSPPPRLKLP